MAANALTFLPLIGGVYALSHGIKRRWSGIALANTLWWKWCLHFLPLGILIWGQDNHHIRNPTTLYHDVVRNPSHVKRPRDMPCGEGEAPVSKNHVLEMDSQLTPHGPQVNCPAEPVPNSWPTSAHTKGKGCFKPLPSGGVHYTVISQGTKSKTITWVLALPLISSVTLGLHFLSCKAGAILSS